MVPGVREGEARLSARLIWLFARVSHHSAEAEELLLRENIGPAEYFDPDTRVSHRVMMDLLRLSFDGGDPEIGLRAGASIQPGDFAVLEYAARSCSTLREAIGCFARYVGLLTDATEISLVEQGERWLLRLDATDGVPQLPAANDFIMAAADRLSKTLCRVYRSPLEAHFAHPKPPYAEAYERVFAMPVRFGTPSNAFVLTRVHLEEALIRSDPDAHSGYERHAEELLSRIRKDSGTTAAVRRVVLASVRGGGAAMGVAARKLAMSVATLRRHLQNEGTTYAQVLDGVRYDLAKRYLRDPGVSTSDVAFLLGFRDASSFSKAFKRWTGGVSAVDFRQDRGAQ